MFLDESVALVFIGLGIIFLLSKMIAPLTEQEKEECRWQDMEEEYLQECGKTFSEVNKKH